MASEKSTKVITGKALFCYVNLIKPTAMNEGDTPKYNCAVLIPKTDKETIAKINNAIKAATQEGLAVFGGKAPAKMNSPLRDGDEERPDDPAFAGMMFLNPKSLVKPGIVDRNLQEIIDPDEIYSGMYGRASLVFYAYSKAGNKGIAVGLNNIQKLEDGERLGGGSSPSEDFGDPLM